MLAKPLRRALALALLSAIPAARADEPKAPAPFKSGFAERDITPEVGSEAPGGYGKSYHRKVHDPCKVRASVFDDGATRVAIVGVDALGLRRESVERVREAVERKASIPGGQVLIGASHSHSSGPCLGVLPGEYDDAPPLVREMAYKQSTTIDPKYLGRVEAALIDAICAANDGRAASRVGIRRGREATVAFNRRFRMRDGRSVTHPGQGNPDIVEPAGPVDPDVNVVGAWDEKDPNRLLGCVVTFACHATTSPGGISANYIYYLERVIQGFYGPDAVVVFLGGATGDVTQVDNRSPYAQPAPERWAQVVGGKVGAEALKVLLTVEPGRPVPVAARSRVWPIARRRPSAEHLRRATELVRAPADEVDPTERTFAKETLMLEALLKREPKATVEVQAVQVGPAVFVTTPAEYFCQYGLEIKANSGFPFTFPVSLANGCVGYVPTEEAFGPDGGGYETRLTSYSNLDITAGRQMRDVGIELARSLTPGAPIAPPPHPPFSGKPWPYGDAPPGRD